MDPPIAEPRVLRRQLPHRGHHRRVLERLLQFVVQRRSRHPISAHALRFDRPRCCAYSAWQRRPARSPFFSADLPHHVELEIAVCHQLLQPRVLVLQRPQRFTSVGSSVP